MVDYLEAMLRTWNGRAILAGIIVSVLMTNACHEGGHALVAWWCGDRRESIRRRATLNPLRHFHWFLTLVLPLLAIWLFGWVLAGARPVVIDAGRIGPRRMALAALAGPLGNFLFCGVVIAAMGFALAQGWVDPVDPIRTTAWRVLKPAVWFSAFLGLLNLIPLPPLDGSRVVGMFLPEKARRVWYLLAPVGMMGLLFLLLWASGQLASAGLGRGYPEVFAALEAKMESWLFVMGEWWREVG